MVSGEGLYTCVSSAVPGGHLGGLGVRVSSWTGSHQGMFIGCVNKSVSGRDFSGVFCDRGVDAMHYVWVLSFLRLGVALLLISVVGLEWLGVLGAASGILLQVDVVFKCGGCH